MSEFAEFRNLARQLPRSHERSGPMSAADIVIVGIRQAFINTFTKGIGEYPVFSDKIVGSDGEPVAKTFTVDFNNLAQVRYAVNVACELDKLRRDPQQRYKIGPFLNKLLEGEVNE